MTSTFTFDNVHLTLQQTDILKNICGQFPKGKITTLLGPSGSGKTTILKLCNHLLSPTSGTVRYNEKKLDDYDPITLRRHIRLALQAAPMIKGSVFYNLALSRTLRGEKLTEDEAIQLLETVSLSPSFLHKNVQKLSGGQRQKLSIARTLIDHPDVLLLDEITSALDPFAVQEIEQLIQSMKARGMTIIWITHNLEQAMRIGDYMWLLRAGEVVESGPIHLLETSENPLVRQFMRGELL